jgi:hypothetical protein
VIWCTRSPYTPRGQLPADPRLAGPLGRDPDFAARFVQRHEVKLTFGGDCPCRDGASAGQHPRVQRRRRPDACPRVIITCVTRCLPLILLSLASPCRAQPDPAEWKSLFDGETLGHWKKTPFAGSPAVRIEEGAIILTAGRPLNGVTWSGDFPKSDYELRFEGARLLGGDFFASVTFPAGGNFATWVLGGWGGDIVGISSIDGWDASDNETRSYFNFQNARWYAFRLQVTGDRIMAWIDGQRVVNAEIRGRVISLRPGDIKLSAPLGFASYNTTGGIRKIEYRSIAAKRQ